MRSESVRRRQASNLKCMAIALVLFSMPAMSSELRAQNANSSQNANTDPSPQRKVKEHPLTPALKLAYRSREAMKQITDYEAIFTKNELVNGRYHAHSMRIKNRLTPFSVYLQFQAPHAGREVIYVTGQNQGNMMVHETGIASLVGAIPIQPTSPQALAESQHPITSIGMWNLIQKIIVQWERESKYGECSVKYYRDAMVGTSTCNVIECRHPQPRKEFPYQVTRLYLEKKTYLPIRVEQYAFSKQPGGKPVEDGTYTFTNVQTNLGLQNVDFDIRNPKYGF